jgi:hypothetical protein
MIEYKDETIAEDEEIIVKTFESRNAFSFSQPYSFEK